MPSIRCSAIEPFTLLDFPGSIACIAFLPGCNFRCGYCHNPEFVLPESLAKISGSMIDEETFFSFLDARKGLLDGVVISGGEPTIHPGLEAFIRHIKDKGFRIKLDTNGSRPDIIARLLGEKLIDYIAMDIKTSLEHYPELVGPCVKPEAIAESIECIKSEAPDYEFRTTLIREIHGLPTLEEMVPLLRGAKRYALQPFRPAVTLDPGFAAYSAPDGKEMEMIADLFRPHVQELILRSL